jgi:hypothetical protein
MSTVEEQLPLEEVQEIVVKYENTVRKYEFPSKAAAQTAIEALDINPVIVHLGHIVTTPAVLDEDGEVVTEALVSDSYSVDVMWPEAPAESWDEHMVWCPPSGVHAFANGPAMNEWAATCKELHPEFFPEPTEEVEQ